MSGMSSNANQVADDLGDLAARLDDLTPAADAAAADVLPVAVAQSPRLTGRLAASLRSVVVATGFSIESDLPYAPIVHARQPWIAETIAAHEQEITRAVEQYVDSAIAATT